MSMCQSLCLDFPIPPPIFLLGMWNLEIGIKHSSINENKSLFDQSSVQLCMYLALNVT